MKRQTCTQHHTTPTDRQQIRTRSTEYSSSELDFAVTYLSPGLTDSRISPACAYLSPSLVLYHTNSHTPSTIQQTESQQIASSHSIRASLNTSAMTKKAKKSMRCICGNFVRLKMTSPRIKKAVQDMCWAGVLQRAVTCC